MIKKVAMAQAFRLCFPDELGGMPYTSDEMTEEMELAGESSVTEKPGSDRTGPDPDGPGLVRRRQPPPRQARGPRPSRSR